VVDIPYESDKSIFNRRFYCLSADQTAIFSNQDRDAWTESLGSMSFCY
jgi:hypothetical protein